MRSYAMKQFDYVITDPAGIHARPAGELVCIAKTFHCNITITKENQTGDCKKIFSLMGLAIKKGQKVTLRFEGDDEDAACGTLREYMQNNL